MAYITKKSDLGGSKAKEKYIAESNISKKPSYITKKSKSWITKKQKEGIIDTAQEATEWIKKKPTEWIKKNPTEWIKKKEYAGGGRATHGYGKAYLKGGKVK